MRAIAELPHPDCRISIFSMNGKFIIKIEQGSLEQVYKIAEINIPDGVNGVFALLDEAFIRSVTERFDSMRASFKETYGRYDA